MVKILQWNARGLIGKWAEAKHFFTDEFYSVICIQETHFLQNDKYSFNLPRFTLYNEYAVQDDRRGGVSVYVSDTLPHCRLPLQTTLQALACSVRFQNRRITVCSLYLPPLDSFSFQDLAQLVAQLPEPYLICTDANSKHLMWGADHCDQRGLLWMNFINQYDVCILNDGQPTRFDEARGSFSHIDLTLVSADIAQFFEWTTVKDLHSSDHFPINIEYQLSRAIPTLPVVFAGWNTKKVDWTAFRQNCVFHFDTDQGVENCDDITKAIIHTAEQFVPMRCTNSKYQCPWWSDDCREAIRRRRRAQNRMRRDPYSVFLRVEYRKVKAQTRRTLRQAQLHSWHELISIFNHRTPMSQLWGILRKFSHKTRISKPFPVLSQNNEIIDEPLMVANTFGKFFADLSSPNNYSTQFLERERQMTASMPDFSSDNGEEYNQAFTLEELKAAVQRSGSTSVGPDKIHYDFIRHLSNNQLSELLKLFNYIWLHDIFPHSWSHSFIIPVLKPGKDCQLVESYRPIQLTSCLCKLMERMIGKRLSWCIERYDLLSRVQCAFRSGRSTADHLLRLDSHVRDGFLHHSTTLAVFLDIKSAYNMVSPTILLNRMHRVGFRGHMMHFIQGYLGNRTFQVRSGVLSDIFRQPYGIVQGGVISPLLFNLAIDSIADVLHPSVSLAIYADDVTIWAQGRHIPPLIRKIQRALNAISRWALQHGFSFSAAKSNAILFRRSLKRVDLATLPDLHLGTDVLPWVDQVKYLGVILDSKLNLATHVEYMKGRAEKRISILKCVAGKRYGADRTILLRMYKALVRPILEYASFILDGAGNRRVGSLETIQNTGLRIATGALRTSPVRAMQVETNVPPLYVRRQELLIRYFLKVQNSDRHPCYGLMNLADYEELYRGLSERYLHRISGFPVAYRLRHILDDLAYQPPTFIPHIDRTIAPWMLRTMVTHMLISQSKGQTDMIRVQAAFQELLSDNQGCRVLFTDGSKMHTSVTCAFTINNYFSSFKLQDGLSIYTAELVAIREAFRYVRNHRIPKALICTDSQSAVKALQHQAGGHPVLTEILDINHRNHQDGLCSTLVWIPGHSGIAGNVRADLWAKRAHDKPDVTRVTVDHREYLPCVKQCVRTFFEKLWQDYRFTQLKRIKQHVGEWASSIRDKRIEEVVLCRLRLGHTLLTHSYLLDHLPAPLCESCDCPLNVEHVLLDCQLYDVARQPLLQACRHAGVRPSLEALLGNGDPSILDALFSYLDRCCLLDKL